MDISSMNIEELEARLSAINKELDGECDISALEAEVSAIEARKKEIAEEAKKAEELRNAIANGEVEITKSTPIMEEKNMEEIRNSKQYIEALANGIKKNDFTECRKLLTENGEDGTVAVPTFCENIIRTNWEKNEILSRVRKTFLKGNVKIGFEIAGDDAEYHDEGDDAIGEESLTLGIAQLVPKMAKKWISISDEVYSLDGEAFLRYIYEELGYRIIKFIADDLVTKIAACDGTGSSSIPAQVVLTEAPSLTTVCNAVANLGDEASDLVIIMNKLTFPVFRGIQANANYGQDIFENLPVLFSSALAAYDPTDDGEIYMIVGDLGRGALANFPNGENVEFKFDDKTLMTADLIRILGKLYVALGIVTPKCFANIAIPEAEAENGGDAV